MRALDAVRGRDAAVGATANAVTATWTAPFRSAGDFQEHPFEGCDGLLEAPFVDHPPHPVRTHVELEVEHLAHPLVPAGRWTGYGAKEEREGKNRNRTHRRLIPERTTGTGVRRVWGGENAKAVPLEKLGCQSSALLDEAIAASSNVAGELHALTTLPRDAPNRPTSGRKGRGGTPRTDRYYRPDFLHLRHLIGQ